MLTIEQRIAFIHANTQLLAPPLVPEIRLHVAHEAVPLWEKTEEQLGEIGLPPPFWAFAWAGGQALARYVLDNSEIIRGRSIIDLASGSGLVGLAAMRAGAARVLAADIDRFAVAAITMNCKANKQSMDVTADDLLNQPAPHCDIILVGDLFYEQTIAARLVAWLEEAKARGIGSLIGDPGRSYLPKDRLCKLAEYSVPVTRDLEDAELKHTSVWTLKA